MALILIPLIILIIAIIIRLLPKRTHEITVDMSLDDMTANVRKLALSLRAPRSFGAGISINNSSRRLEKVYASISQKVKNGEELYDFEKQLYENFHLLRKLLIKANYTHFTTLPHKHLDPRIVTIANFIVKSSSRRLTRDKVESIIATFNKSTTLHWEELSSLKNAILYILLREMADYGQRSMHYNHMKNLAESTDKIHSKSYLSDSYLYYFKQKWGPVKNFKAIRNSEINIDNVDNSFISALIDNSVAVSAILDSIRNINTIIDMDLILSLTPAHCLMIKDKNYQDMDIESKKSYLKRVGEISDYMNVSEQTVVESAKKLEEINETHFGEFLFGNTRRIKYFIRKGEDKLKNIIISDSSKLYISATVGVSIILAISFGFLSSLNVFARIGISLLLVFCFLPVIQHIYSFLFKYSKRLMPMMNYTRIPKEGKTLVVVSELIPDKKTAKSAFRHIRELSKNTVDDNVEYLILADLKESQEVSISEDSDLISKIKAEFEKCNGQNINIAIRKRTKCGKKYIGWERKRGALMDLSKHLIEEGHNPFIYVGKKISKPEFMVLLDADNELLPGGIRRAINSMLHPLNKKYDLLTFGSAYNMHSIKTYFSRKFLGGCGIPDYGKNSDYIYDMSRYSLFCGKGIVRLENFYTKLKDKFPENRILSHDIIEGAILNSGALQERVYEDAPRNIVADIDRKSRWIRGDIQLNNYIYDASLQQIYRYTLLTNIIKPILPLFQLGLFIIFLYTQSWFLLGYLVLTLLASPVINILGALNMIFFGQRVKYILANVFYIIKNTLEDIFFLPFNAFNGLFLFLVTGFRLVISKKNLLKWQTFKSMQNVSKFNKYLAMIIPSFIIMTALSVLMYMHIAFAVYTGLYIIYAIGIFFTSMEILPKNFLSPKDEKLIKESAKKIYKYFENNLREDNNYLIPDNYQAFPYKGDRFSTSPSNIGLSLTSIISANELGIIHTDKAIDKLLKILHSIDSLKKWNGHLYNWYETNTKKVLYPYYISSVDSANFIACLYVVLEWAKENKKDDLINLSQKIIDETDFSKLFDNKVKLFYIGYNEAKKELCGHYDLLASESRTLSYIYTAKSQDISHWMNLSRECVALRGNTLVSWSGTTFEYLLPEIFLETPRYSLIGKSNNNLVKEQIKQKIKGVWGISEGGYYRFDELMNYQYKAFGLRELSLRSDYSRPVITPYSSILSLPYNPKAVCRNLQILKSRDMYGEYGFYEALDMYSKDRVVQSFMAHHLGMSIATIANFLCNNKIKKLFNNNTCMASAKLILTEEICKNKFINIKDDSLIYANSHPNAKYDFTPTKSMPEFNALSNGIYGTVIDDYGSGYSISKGVYLNRFREYKDNGLFAYIYDKNENKTFCPSFAPIRDDNGNYKVTYSPNSCVYENTVENFKMEIFTPPCFKGEVRKYTYVNESEKGKDLRVAFYSDLILNYFDSDIGHPTFNDMFIETSYINEKNAIIGIRKSLDGKDTKYCAMVIKGLDELKVDTNRMTFMGRNNTASNLNVFTNNYNYEGDRLGKILYPCFGAFTDIGIQAKKSLECYTATIIADSMEELLQEISEANSTDFLKSAEISSKVVSANYYYKCLKSNRNDLRNLVNIYFKGYSQEKLRLLSDSTTKTKLERLGYCLHHKNLLFEYTGVSSDNSLRQYIGAVKFLNTVGINYKLFIVYDEGNFYHEAKEKKIRDILTACEGHKIDYHILNQKNIDDDEYLLLRKCAYGIAGKIEYKNIKNSISCKINKMESTKYLEETISLECGEGGFTEKGDYIVNAFDHATMLPYSNVVAGKSGGFVVTNNGGGYTFADNSREKKMTLNSNDVVSDIASEYITLKTRNGQIRINTTQTGMTVRHAQGYTEFTGLIDDIKISHEQYIIKNGKVKIYDTNLSTTKPQEISLFYYAYTALGWKEDKDYVLKDIISDKVVKLTNIKTNQSVCLCVFESGDIILDTSKYKTRECPKDIVLSSREQKYEENHTLFAKYKCKIEQSKRLTFAIGACLQDIETLTIDEVDTARIAQNEYFSTLSNIKIDTSDKSLDLLFNNWLMYQVVSSRINGKCGFYQSGGAVGFRDQLQDHLSRLYNDPNCVHDHILLSARHQYQEGDVQHWWHFDRFGVRTKIKDDAVFLPYVVCKYIEATGDTNILEIKENYLVSEPLNENEHSRLETPEISIEKESLEKHCLKAIKNVLHYGEHNLLLIGGGDWNDALDGVGLKGKGESVWLTQFTYMTIMKFVNYLNNEDRLELLKHATRMKRAVNDQAWDGEWFKRIFTDNGEWLGSKSSEVCKIDLLCQSFATLANIGDEDKNMKALESAKQLVNEDKGYIKLLSPPFNYNKWYGYISGYPEGIRENGGQYTHGAIWYVMALFRANKVDEGYKLLKLLNPVSKLQDKKMVRTYQGEPYAIPADIYSAKDYNGRMGWNFYTGSASWYYRLIVGELLGIKLEFNALVINPKLPSELEYMNVDYHYNSTIYRIKIKRGKTNSMEVDGVEVVNNNTIPLNDNGKIVEVIINVA